MYDRKYSDLFHCEFKTIRSTHVGFLPSFILPFPLPPSILFLADTKRKVEQISEELRSLDEMLAGNEGADGAVEVTAEESLTVSSDDSEPSGGKGDYFFLQLMRKWLLL